MCIRAFGIVPLSFPSLALCVVRMSQLLTLGRLGFRSDVFYAVYLLQRYSGGALAGSMTSLTVMRLFHYRIADGSVYTQFNNTTLRVYLALSYHVT